MSDGFKITKDRYYRGNGRWAKVQRMHRETIVNEKTVWIPYWYLAVGREGEVNAFLGEEFRKAKIAHESAKDYINGLL